MTPEEQRKIDKENQKLAEEIVALLSPRWTIF